ncbi:protein FAM207A isoform X5 [Rhinatrema bivittatum]|uniref:protein FAM207A isoform X5 n=1 Tax=Rhinatrema bivittatum TaxID=194408 RepID=UPI001126840E|nr:protein FAM207A isoform X5 [Rhinatrema bivittatum]
MVGKMKRVRQRLHQAAVRPREALTETGTAAALAGDAAAASAGDVCLPGSAGWLAPVGGKDWALLSSDIFATTRIDPLALVQKLDTDTKSIISAKKEIDALKLAHQKQKAQAKRKATPVVGDMQPLVDALPELSELLTVSKPREARKRSKTSVKKKAPPTEYSQMKPAQKRQLIEKEVTHFHEVISNPSYKANPLTAVREHLAKRMKQEEEGNTH